MGSNPSIPKYSYNPYMPSYNKNKSSSQARGYSVQNNGFPNSKAVSSAMLLPAESIDARAAVMHRMRYHCACHNIQYPLQEKMDLSVQVFLYILACIQSTSQNVFILSWSPPLQVIWLLWVCGTLHYMVRLNVQRQNAKPKACPWRFLWNYWGLY